MRRFFQRWTCLFLFIGSLSLAGSLSAADEPATLAFTRFKLLRGGEVPWVAGFKLTNTSKAPLTYFLTPSPGLPITLVEVKDKDSWKKIDAPWSGGEARILPAGQSMEFSVYLPATSEPWRVGVPYAPGMAPKLDPKADLTKSPIIWSEAVDKPPPAQ